MKLSKNKPNRCKRRKAASDLFHFKVPHAHCKNNYCLVTYGYTHTIIEKQKAILNLSTDDSEQCFV